MLMHVVFDLKKKTIALRTGVSENKVDFFCKFSHKFPCNFSISLVQNILNRSRKFISCVRVAYENKTQMLLNPSVQFFIVIIDRKEKYALCLAEV